MLTLYCDPRSRECQCLNENLSELSIGHRMVGVTDPAQSPLIGCGGRTPALVDGQQFFCGSKEVEGRLSTLRERSKKSPGKGQESDFEDEDWSSG